jgi:hypothetical protein
MLVHIVAFFMIVVENLCVDVVAVNIFTLCMKRSGTER